MRLFTFNDLSFRINKDQFTKKIDELIYLGNLCNSYNHPLYIHKNGLFSAWIGEIKIKEAIQSYLAKEKKTLFFRLMDKSVLKLPDESAIPNGYIFKYNDNDISCSGLAECAFRQLCDESVSTYSLSETCFQDHQKLCVKIHDSNAKNDSIEEQHIINISNLVDLESCLKHELPPLSSWNDLLDRTKHFDKITIVPNARESLLRESFEISLACTIWERLKVVQAMIEAPTNEYHELDRKYCHGERALFSPESTKRINSLGEKLNFCINGEKICCDYHAKISHRTWRIHMNEKPKTNKQIHIVHIGHKII
ncbi:hypothetical protein [Desulfovibrio litoralis]|uniref:Uncharacterized protein n=1 Tax=Desulfovibrio litoralis DSM 11393 TaxID=1121455 RepID=A0A1M7TM15_9BACT|nr:hypothetical protein [Desulfovibrio litoralis]SHN71688.1 hypothetical protein SAMN02745728_02228 [Desulfovibrio litoralis DSM 11393]